MTRYGIVTMARHEFRLRIRAGAWRRLLLLWFVLVMGFTALVHASVRRTYPDAQNKGVVVYGALVLFVLALSLLVVPTLTGQSVNGDRERGTLATLQVTLLSPGEIAVGKLVAAWGAALVFLVLTIPAVLYASALGGVPLGRVLVVYLVIGLLLGVVSSLALCLSALLMRTTTSGVMSYLTVFALTAGTLITFAIGLATTTEHFTDRNTCPTRAELLQQGLPADQVDQILAGCGTETFDSTRTRADKVWWLLAANPFVIVADAAPQLPRRLQTAGYGGQQPDLHDSDPLGNLGRAVRDLRLPPSQHGQRRAPVWPYGLGFDLLLGGGALWVTARRLKTPSRALPRGQRVA